MTSVPTILVDMIGREPLPTLVSLIAMSDRFNDIVYDTCVVELCKRLPGVRLLSEAELILTVLEDKKSTEYFSEARVVQMKSEAVAKAGIAQATGMSSTDHVDKYDLTAPSYTGGSSASGTQIQNTPCRKMEVTPDSHRIGALETAMSAMSRSMATLTSSLLNEQAAQQQNRLLQQVLVNNLGVPAGTVAQQTSINESALLQQLLQQKSSVVSPSSTNPNNVVLPQLTADQLVGGVGGAPLATTTVHASTALLQQQRTPQQQQQVLLTGAPEGVSGGGSPSSARFQSANSSGTTSGIVVTAEEPQGAPASSPANSDSSMVLVRDVNAGGAAAGSAPSCSTS